jgi:hypothetical protein
MAIVSALSHPSTIESNNIPEDCSSVASILMCHKV